MDSAYKDERVIFKAALKKKLLTERAAYIKKACGSDSELLVRVEALLKAHDEAGNFLEAPVLDPVVTLEDSPLTEGPGTVIGRYKLLEKIGEGGFGVVYMADQTKPISRRVALKIIKLGMDTKEVNARFEAERQALAMMEHPNIAKVLDAGATDTGRPYFVMELVKGIPITEYCDNNNLDTKQRLELFISICKALQHAHQKGIIHRDLKPSNVLITLHDGKPVPKVIDFGIAKATGQRLTERTLFTRFAQMIGTPEYMSPEQAEFSGLDVDTRSDIYSLGVLLYQLLTGFTPFDGDKLREAGYVEMQRIIREEDPDKPSTRLSTMGKALTDIAKHRRVAPETLRKLIRGDLDWIVMKTLEKDRTRRYETASELAKDIERHLSDEFVLASPPSVRYRLRKFVRRNRVAVTTGLLITAALLIAAVVSAIYAHKATINANEAENARLNAEKAQQETAGLLAASYVDRAQALCEQGEVGRGMLWLAESLKVAPEGSHDLDQAVRTSLAAWHGQLHSLRAVARYPAGQYPRVQRPQLAGSFTKGPTGSYTMTSSGTDIWDTADQFHFAFKTLTGLGSVAVRVDSLENTHEWDKAGLMIRDTTAPDSAFAAVFITPENRVCLQYRYATGQNALSIHTDANAVALPQWIRLAREGSVFRAQHSEDGREWKDLEGGSTFPVLATRPAVVNMDLSDPVCVGLALTSHAEAQICEAVFSNFKTTGSVSADWAHQDIHAETNATESPYPRQINSVTFSPDGSHLLVGCQDGTVRICDGTTGQPIGRPLHQGSGVSGVAISPNGMRIATGGPCGWVRLWDVLTREPIGKVIRYEDKDDWAPVMAFSPDGSQLVTGGVDGAIRLWDADTGESLGKVFQYESEGERRVLAAAFCPSGLRVVLRTGWWTMQVFDADRGVPIGSPVDNTGPTTASVISPDGARYATVKIHSRIQIWDAATGKPVFEPIVQGGVIYALAFSPDGSRIVSAGNTRIAMLWDSATGEPIGAPLRQRDTIRTAAFSPDGKRIATGNQDGVLRIWDLIHNKYVGKPVKYLDQILAVACGPDGFRILAEADGAIQVRDAATGKPIGRPIPHPGRIEFIVFSPDGMRLATSSRTEADESWYVRLYDLSRGELVGKPFDRGAARMAFSPDGSRILTAGAPDRAARLWDVATLNCLGEFRQHQRHVSAAAYSPDGSLFLTGSYDGTTQLWNAITLEPVGAPLVHQSEVKDAAFSPDGAKFLIGFADGTVRLWDTATRKPIGTPLQQLKVVSNVAFSPDGSRLLACCIDRTARLWDGTTLKPIGPHLEHNCWWPTMSSFSSDGSEILLADRDATAAIWQAPPDPLPGAYEQIACWVQVVTGMELDATGGINVLDASEWQQRRRRLQELGGPPDLALAGR
jgi:WD40 repeat protein/serine/threonine protein kinase